MASERKSSSIEPTPYIENNGHDSKPVQKLVTRKPTFKEFQGKMISNRGSKLIKSQSLDHEPMSPTNVNLRPVTPSSKPNVKSFKESNKKEKKVLSRRAREVFLVPENHDGKDKNSEQTEEIRKCGI